MSEYRRPRRRKEFSHQARFTIPEETPTPLTPEQLAEQNTQFKDLLSRQRRENERLHERIKDLEKTLEAEKESHQRTTWQLRFTEDEYTRFADLVEQSGIIEKREQK